MRTIIVSLLQLASLVAFVALCAWIPRAADWASKRRRILMLAAYIVTSHLVIGISQKDGWPIANYRLMHGKANPGSEFWRIGFFGTDAAGREWRVDPYAWRSTSDWHLQFWFYIHFETASAADRQQVLREIYGHAERSRGFVAREGRLPWPSILGPLTAPQWWLFDREQSAPPQPYRSIRVYKEAWVWKERLENGTIGERKLLAEWSPQ